MSITTRWTGALAAAVAVLLTGCSGDDDGSGDAGSPAPDDPAASSDAAPPSGLFGAPEAPLPVGVPIAFERWHVTIDPAEQRDGPADPARPDLGGPDDGSTFLVAEFAVVSTYQQGQAMNVFGGLEFTVQGASGERHAEPCVADNPMNTTAWLAAPAQQVANVCVEVPLDDLDGAVWRIGQRGAGEDAYVALS